MYHNVRDRYSNDSVCSSDVSSCCCFGHPVVIDQRKEETTEKKEQVLSSVFLHAVGAISH